MNINILNFVKKGSYYNSVNEQQDAINISIKKEFENNRLLFALSLLLDGTAYSKGMLSKVLLNNKQDENYLKLLNDYNLPDNFEKDIIMYNLRNERQTLILKNLLMLVKKDGITGVNNSRTKSIILNYLFNRDKKSLENMLIKYKIKFKQLVIHALGEKEFTRIYKYHGRSKDLEKYNVDYHLILRFLKNYEIRNYVNYNNYKKLQVYNKCREYAKAGNTAYFLKNIELHKNVIPVEVLTMFNINFNLGINLNDIYSNANISARQRIQNDKVIKEATRGVNIEDIDYKKYDLYELFKFLYFKASENDESDIDEIIQEIYRKSRNKVDLGFGDSVIILDSSSSMQGSDNRKLHPYLTGIVLSNLLDNSMTIQTGGNKIKIKDIDLIYPADDSILYKSFIEAVEEKPDTIIIISDGYENRLKGLLNAIYESYKKDGLKSNVVHLNPVFAKEDKGCKRLINDVEPIPFEGIKTLKTSLMMNSIKNDEDKAIEYLIDIYNKLARGIS